MSKQLVRSIKNVANGYSSGQKLVRNATSNDPSGPTTTEMEEIASHTYQSQTDFLEIMDMLDRRLNDKGKNWRHVAKSLTVLDYLVRFGSEKCVLWAKDNLYIVKTLREFIHFDEQHNDQGAIVRVKAKELVALLRDDERLRHERDLAASSKGRNEGRNWDRQGTPRRNTLNFKDRGNSEDEDLQKALEISRLTAREEQNRQHNNGNDEDLQAALKLSLEEEEMRRLKQQQNENLLDLSDDQPQPQAQPQYYLATGYMQQPQYYTQGAQVQYDMFGNPIQNPMTTGLYQPQQIQQQQTQPQPQLQQQQIQQPQQSQFTGFNYGQPQQELQPLKTGSNNPFALNGTTSPPPQQQTLNDLASKQNNVQENQQTNFSNARQDQPQFFTQPTQQIKPQSTASSKFNESHADLNNLLAEGPGLDTFGNTGTTRIPHHHTKTENFISSTGTGIKSTDNSVKLSSNATGNPFLNTGIGYQQPSQINAAYTGYGFGNSNANQYQQQNQKSNEGPSLIDI